MHFGLRPRAILIFDGTVALKIIIALIVTIKDENGDDSVNDGDDNNKKAIRITITKQLY